MTSPSRPAVTSVASWNQSHPYGEPDRRCVPEVVDRDPPESIDDESRAAPLARTPAQPHPDTPVPFASEDRRRSTRPLQRPTRQRNPAVGSPSRAEPVQWESCRCPCFDTCPPIPPETRRQTARGDADEENQRASALDRVASSSTVLGGSRQRGDSSAGSSQRPRAPTDHESHLRRKI